MGYHPRGYAAALLQCDRSVCTNRAPGSRKLRLQRAEWLLGESPLIRRETSPRGHVRASIAFSGQEVALSDGFARPLRSPCPAAPANPGRVWYTLCASTVRPGVERAALPAPPPRRHPINIPGVPPTPEDATAILTRLYCPPHGSNDLDLG